MLCSIPVLQHLLSAFHLPRALGRDFSHSLINKDTAEGLPATGAPSDLHPQAGMYSQLGRLKRPICQCNAKCNFEQINWKHNCLSPRKCSCAALSSCHSSWLSIWHPFGVRRPCPPHHPGCTTCLPSHAMELRFVLHWPQISIQFCGRRPIAGTSLSPQSFTLLASQRRGSEILENAKETAL